MGKSVTDICNMALGRIGISRFIADINEASNEAAVCRTFYETSRDTALCAAPWGFATALVELQDVGDPPTEWLYRYRYPSDCLAARRIVPSDNNYPEPFSVVSDITNNALSICCNVQPATLEYTARVTNSLLFSQGFIYALAWLLASEIAAPLTANVSLAASAGKQYADAITSAIAASLNEGEPDQLTYPESDFILARR